MRHGHAREGHKTPEYSIWVLMKYRCSNPNSPDYANYGGRGIRVCERWRESFAAFLADVGLRPTPRHTIDRLDNAGHYEPGNVQWIPKSLQSRNRRTTFWFDTADGPACLAELARKHGMKPAVLNGRLRRGWPLDAALSTPTLTRGDSRRHSLPDSRPPRPMLSSGTVVISGRLGTGPLRPSLRQRAAISPGDRHAK